MFDTTTLRGKVRRSPLALSQASNHLDHHRNAQSAWRQLSNCCCLCLARSAVLTTIQQQDHDKWLQCMLARRLQNVMCPDPTPVEQPVMELVMSCSRENVVSLWYIAECKAVRGTAVARSGAASGSRAPKVKSAGMRQAFFICLDAPKHPVI